MATIDIRNVAWPASDLEIRGAMDAVPAPGDKEAVPAVPARHLSRLAIELAAAIRSTSESARDAQLAHVADEANVVSARIAEQLVDGSAVLRQQADEDIADIRDWAKTEAARIKAEADAKVAARKLLLEDQVAGHEAATHDREARVQAVVAGYQRTMDDFFARFLAEDDPARLATIAETMPEPPSLEAFTEPDGAWDDVSNPPAMPSAVAELEAGVDTWADHEAEVEGPAAAAPVEPEPAGSADEAEAQAALMASGLEDEPDGPIAALQSPGPEPAPAPEVATGGKSKPAREAAAQSAPPAPAQGSRAVSSTPAVQSANVDELRATEVIVSGLVSVASVASFRRALGRMPGVASVTVTSGSDGAFLFHVLHRGEADLRAAIPSLPGFVAKVTGMMDDAVMVTTLDPEGEQ